VSAATRIARLEALLARVNERKALPRVTAAPPVRITRDIAAQSPANVPPPVTPAVPQHSHEPSWGTSEHDAAPPPATVPSATTRASRPPPEMGVEDLPDLDLVETAAESGETHHSLIPSQVPPAGEAEGGEFEIPGGVPSSTESANVPASTAAPIEIEPVDSDEELGIQHTPLASVTIPPRVAPEPEAELEPELPPASAHAAMSAAASIAATAAASVAVGVVATVAAGAAAVSALAPPDVGEPEVYEAEELTASGDVVELRAPAPPRATSFRMLVERTLALRVR
jgi:hypothetical protein